MYQNADTSCACGVTSRQEASTKRLQAYEGYRFDNWRLRCAQRCKETQATARERAEPTPETRKGEMLVASS